MAAYYGIWRNLALGDDVFRECWYTGLAWSLEYEKLTRFQTARPGLANALVTYKLQPLTQLAFDTRLAPRAVHQDDFLLQTSRRACLQVAGVYTTESRRACGDLRQALSRRSDLDVDSYEFGLTSTSMTLNARSKKTHDTRQRVCYWPNLRKYDCVMTILGRLEQQALALINMVKPAKKTKSRNSPTISFPLDRR